MLIHAIVVTVMHYSKIKDCCRVDEKGLMGSYFLVVVCDFTNPLVILTDVCAVVTHWRTELAFVN